MERIAVKNPVVILVLTALGTASAAAQDAVVTRRGDGTTVLPGDDGEITITTRTAGPSGPIRIPRRPARLKEKELDRFLRDRAEREAGWT